MVDDHSLYAFMRTPEKEYAVPVYPSASITFLNAIYDEERDAPNDYKARISTDALEHSAVFEDFATPYLLVYQLDFWSKYKKDMNSILKQWGVFAKKRFTLPVKDESGNIRKCLLTLIGSLVPREYMSGGERIYQTSQVFNVQVEIDLGIQETIPIVTEIIIDRVDIHVNP